MTRYVLRRVGFSLVTLWLVVTIVFMINNVFPSDVGRRLAGPFQSQAVVDEINEELGTNDPLIVQYGRMLKSVVTLDFGDSYVQNKPVTEVIGSAFWRSLKLAAYALVLTIPLSIAAGIFAARRQGKLADRTIVTAGLASSSIPEFVSCVILQVVIGWKLGWFHVIAQAPQGSGFLTQLSYLTLPALAVVITYFGYIARMTRAGVIRALDADYTRTATMKGLPTNQVIRHHVLRNGLQPTVSVVGVQVGYVLGSLVVIEKIFNYPGLGGTIASAAAKDPPVLVAGVLVVAIVYMLATLSADLILAWMNPRASIAASSEVVRAEPGMSATEPLTTAVQARVPEQERSERGLARKERWRLLRRRPGFVFGVVVLAFWVFCAIGGERVAPYGAKQTGLPSTQPPSRDYLFGTDTLGRDVFSRVLVGAREVFLTAPLVALLCVSIGTLLGLTAGYMRGWVDDVISRIMEAILAIPVILIGLVVLTNFGTSRYALIVTVAFIFTPIVYRTVRASTLAEAELDYVTSARLRGEGALFTMTREILPNISGPIIVETTVRVGYAIFTIATLQFLVGGADPASPAWGTQVSQMYTYISGGTWWPTVFPALALASVVIAVNLIADSIEEVYAS